MEKQVAKELFDAVQQYGLIRVIRRVLGVKAKLRIGFTKDVLRAPIEELTLSVRGFNVLKRNNLHTIGDVIDAIQHNELITLRNLGAKTIRDIKTKIVIFGYDALSDEDKKAFLLETVKLNSK